jgi:hypothetical protein
MLKKVLIWGCISFFIFMLAFRPSYVIDVVQTLGSGLRAIGDWVSFS